MFDQRWLSLLVVMAFVGAIMRSPALIGVVLLSGTLILLSHLLRRYTLKGVTYSRRFSENRLFLGETVTVTCTTANHSRLPLISLDVNDSAPREFLAAVDQSDPAYRDTMYATAAGRLHFTHLVALLPGEQTSRRVRLKSTQRGYYVFDGVELRAADLLGMFEVDRVDHASDSVIVYPRVYPLEELGIATREPYGALQTLRGLIEEPSLIIGARDYVTGDSFRQIHWKATAHRGSLQTRVCEYTSDPTAIILLNVTTFPLIWQGTDVVRFEWAVSVAASIATWAHNDGAVVGLISNGNVARAPKSAYVRPLRSPDQLTRVLESLAVIGPYTFQPFEEFLVREQVDVPSGATQIVVTPLLTPQVEITLRQLHDRGKRMVLICVDRAQPDMTSLPFPAYHVPPSPDLPVIEDDFVPPLQGGIQGGNANAALPMRGGKQAKP